ncbi:MAG: lytic transglycosylase domain-containing protein [Mesorhizobium sp.]|nr:lytic transglycosylase domain-containing protein [Mesorhizobium sp.]
MLALLIVLTPALAEERAQPLLHRICALVALHADQNGLPRDFLARLIWKESRFNPNAVSPKGAEGIAQFMPTTAAMRGLDDAFDIEQAIPASAAYLGELRQKYGNLGLAAAAYNAGEGRISRWLDQGGFLPMETENYVLGILGEPADIFVDRTHRARMQPLDPRQPFSAACRALPISGAATVAMANVEVKPWGVQVAGHFRRDVAIRQWERLRASHSSLLAGHDPVVSNVRSARGRSGIQAVRIGASDQAEADRICDQLRGAGAACIVLRNR